MSLLNRGMQMPGKSAAVAQAEQEMDILTNLFNSMVEGCHTKCIPTNYHDGELNKGESVCIDRCVAKFFDVYAKLGEKLQKNQQKQQQ